MTPATDFFYGWAGLNVWLFALTQQYRPFVPESLISFLSSVGSFYVAPYFARAIGAQALSIARADRSRVIRKCASGGAWAKVLARFLVGGAIAAAIVALLKSSLPLPRPWEIFDLPAEQPWLAGDAGESFPSGHAAFAAVVVGTLWGIAPRQSARISLLVFLIAVGLARILAGAHFPADVIGGYAAGFAGIWAAEVALRLAAKSA